MKRLLAIPFLLIAVGLAYAPPPPSATSQPIVQHIAKILPAQVKDVPLDVSGAGVKDATKVVYEPKIVKYKTVESFPFTVKAPAGAFMYFWQYPALLPVVDRNDELDITSAPEGDLVIRVKAIYLIIDDKGVFKGAETKIGTIPLWIGKAPPGPTPPVPPGPNPPTPPVPVNQFEKDLFSAWKAAPTNISRPLLLAALARETATVAETDKTLTTAYQIYQKIWLAAVESKFKPLADPGAELVAIRKLLGAEFNSVLPKQMNAPLDDAARQLCKTHFNRIAASLEKLEGVK